VQKRKKYGEYPEEWKEKEFLLEEFEEETMEGEMKMM
jgi:hypothetical protein